MFRHRSGPARVGRDPETQEAPWTRRQRAVQTRLLIQELVNNLPPQDLTVLLERVHDTLHPSDAALEANLLAEKLTNGRRYSTTERASLEILTVVRAFERRRELLENSLTSTQVARILGTSRQTPHDRLKSGTLLAVLDNGAWRFPAWQFDPNGPDAVVPGLPQAIAALEHVPTLAQISWFVRPNAHLDGRSPIDALKRGELSRVLSVARAVRAA